jgi:uroporphyrinogen decarboxylase
MHNREVLQDAETLGLARVDKEQGLVFDIWGVGWDLQVEGVFIRHHPIQDIAQISEYAFPDPDIPGLMSYAEKLVASQGNEYFIVAFQHISLFERAWSLLGFENLMIAIAEDNPYLDDLFRRIGDYQVAVAKNCSICKSGNSWFPDYSSIAERRAAAKQPRSASSKGTNSLKMVTR